MVADDHPRTLVTHGGLAAQGGSPTGLNRAHGAEVLPRQRVRGAVRRPIGAKDIGQFQAVPCRMGVLMGAHDLVPQPGIIELIQRRGRIQQMPAGEVEIVQRRANAGMAQEALDGVRVIARFEKVRGKGVPQGRESGRPSRCGPG